MNINTGEMEAKRLSRDIISSLPPILIENILCRVPIRDAVRTSILSRNWRFSWATIPKLVFRANNMFGKSNAEHQLEQPGNGRKQLTEMCKVYCAIHQVLLLHLGPILEFSLSMYTDNRRVEIDQILLHLSRKNTVKKLALHFLDSLSYKVPSSVFSLHQLTELSLNCCELDLNLAFGRLPSLTSLSLTDVTIYKQTFPHPDLNPAFGGLGSLTSLSLIDVNIYREAFLHLISTSPLLKRLSLQMLWDKEIEAVPLNYYIIELFKFFPLIEHLSISSWTVADFKYSAQDAVPRELLTTLVHLKSLCMWEMLLHSKSRLLGLFLLIRISPNLEKIKLKQEYETGGVGHEINSLEDYSDIWLEHVHELEIRYFTNSKLELEFVKLILAKSPVLKKVRIRLCKCIGNDEELKMLRILIRCQRASVVAEIIVERVKR